MHHLSEPGKDEQPEGDAKESDTEAADRKDAPSGPSREQQKAHGEKET